MAVEIAEKSFKEYANQTLAGICNFVCNSALSQRIMCQCTSSVKRNVGKQIRIEVRKMLLNQSCFTTSPFAVIVIPRPLASNDSRYRLLRIGLLGNTPKTPDCPRSRAVERAYGAAFRSLGSLFLHIRAGNTLEPSTV